MNAVEQSLFEAQMLSFRSGEMLRDAMARLLPHLPETAPEIEKLKVAIAATKTVCDHIHATLCAAEARRDETIVPFRGRT